MYLTELIEENSSTWPTAGNYFYLDMLSALRWINRNIIDYGDNASNVLLFGESTGAPATVDICFKRFIKSNC
jgi:para-nitrobenzyl esterase